MGHGLGTPAEDARCSPAHFLNLCYRNTADLQCGINFSCLALLLLLLSRFSDVRLCGPHRWQPTRPPVPGILQARTLEWVAISLSNACMRAKSLQSCPTLCNPMDSSPPGTSVHRILWARILEWVAISFL